jgi:outer membrane immunogenic protein
MLRRILLASVALALAGTAFAADLPSQAPPPVYVPPPPMWTGFYIGLNAGGTWSSSGSTNVSSFVLAANPGSNLFPVPTAFAAADAATGRLSSSPAGFIGGGQVGFNYQFANSFVAGIEADIQGVASGGGTSTVPNFVFAALPNVATGAPFPNNFVETIISASNRLDYLGTVRGRVGFLFTPTLLVYGTGGLAYGGVSSNTNISGSTLGPNLLLADGNAPYFSNGGFSNTRVGWTVGGGLEWLFLPNWSAKIEYLYYNLGSVSYSAGIPTSIIADPGTVGGLVVGSPFYSLASRSSTSFNGNIVRLGVNYHFIWGAPAPLVAKY